MFIALFFLLCDVRCVFSANSHLVYDFHCHSIVYVGYRRRLCGSWEVQLFSSIKFQWIVYDPPTIHSPYAIRTKYILKAHTHRIKEITEIGKLAQASCCCFAWLVHSKQKDIIGILLKLKITKTNIHISFDNIIVWNSFFADSLHLVWRFSWVSLSLFLHIYWIPFVGAYSSLYITSWPKIVYRLVDYSHKQ